MGEATRVRVRVAAVFLVDRLGRVLMRHRDAGAPVYPNLWQMVGGIVEDGESPEEAARREVLEETGLVVEGALEVLWRCVTERPPPLPGDVEWFLYAAATDAAQEDVVCCEGDAMEFHTPAEAFALPLTPRAAEFFPAFFASDTYRRLAARGGFPRGGPS
jgi:8-oxo-dGTP diphosphatase